nr:hypothetical protein Iba_chr05cCG18240 [Ipomoea batatas]
MAKMAQPWILPPGSDTSNTQRQTICAGSDTITDTASVLIRQLIGKRIIRPVKDGKAKDFIERPESREEDEKQSNGPERIEILEMREKPRFNPEMNNEEQGEERKDQKTSD